MTIKASPVSRHNQDCPGCQRLLQTLHDFLFFDPLGTRATGLPAFARLSVLSAAFKGEGCLGRSDDDEPVFVLVARDKAASMIVRDWAALVERMGGSAEKVADARDIADEMERWREAHGGGKLPD